VVKEFNRQFRVGQGGLLVITATQDIPQGDQPRIILVDASAGPVIATLFKSIGNGGKKICIKKIDSSTNLVTVVAASGETIDGLASESLVAENDSIDLVSDNENWIKAAGGVQSSVTLGQGSVDHFALAHALPEKYINEVWQYVNNASILEHWSNPFGTIARSSDHFIITTSGSGVGQIGALTLQGVSDVRVSPRSNYTKNALTFKHTVRLLDVTLADYFIGLSVVSPNGVATTAAWLLALTGAIGFVTEATDPNFKGYIESAPDQEIIDLGIPKTSAITQLAFTVNASGQIEFFIDGVLVGTSTNSPDARPIAQMAIALLVRSKAAATRAMQNYGVSASTTFLNF